MKYLSLILVLLSTYAVSACFPSVGKPIVIEGVFTNELVPSESHAKKDTNIWFVNLPEAMYFETVCCIKKIQLDISDLSSSDMLMKPNSKYSFSGITELASDSSHTTEVILKVSAINAL